VEEYFSTIHLPPNIIVFSAQKNVDRFYQRAKLVLNLSHPDRWVETFGLTLLEGMQYGIPVIGPPVGGPAELIESGVCGFSTHHLEKKTLKDQIQILANDPMKYQQFSRQAFQRADQFSAKKMIDQIEALLSCRMKLTSLSLT
jgi:glycosyltransferase involved in cell wall biosynthesis